MAAKLISSPLIQAIDANGDPYSGAQLYIYDAGTTSLRTTYNSSSLSTANSNPLIADSAGRFGPIYVAGSGTALKLSLYTSADVLVWTQDNVPVTDGSFDVVSSSDLNADGVTDDSAALNSIFAANEIVTFSDSTLVYAIESALEIPAGSDVDFHGATIRKTVSDATDGYQITVGAGATIRNLNFEVPTGVTILRGITLTDNARAYNTHITATTQNNNLGSASRSVFEVDGNNTVVEGLTIEKFDKAILITDSDDGHWSDIIVSSYATGISMADCERYTLTNYHCHTKSANATASPGQDGMVIETCNYGALSNINIQNAPEHGIYFSCSDLGGWHTGFSNVLIEKSAQCGFKLSGNDAGDAEDINIAGLSVVDCSFGSTSGTNEDGLRIEYANRVTVSGYSYTTDADADGAFNGIYIRQAHNISIASPFIQSVADSGILITDEGAAETCTNILITSPQILLAGKDGVEIDFDTASSDLRNIVITDLWAYNPVGYGVNVNATDTIVQGQVLITGYVIGATSGVYNNANDNGDTFVNVSLKAGTRFATLTGTVALNPYIKRQLLDSTSGAVTATLPDMESSAEVGHRITVQMSNASNSSTLSVTSHETSSPEVFTFAQTTDVLILEWIGTRWATIYNNGAAT